MFVSVVDRRYNRSNLYVVIHKRPTGIFNYETSLRKELISFQKLPEFLEKFPILVLSGA